MQLRTGRGGNMSRFAIGYEYLCRIVLMLMVVNLAFIVHTLMGLVIIGFFPSVAASYATFRTWLIQVEDRSWTIARTWRVFHRAWKREFKRANVMGWPLGLIWALLLWERWFVSANDLGVAGAATYGVLVVVNLVYGLFVFLSWAVYVNFDESPWWVLRTSLSMVIARPMCSLMVLCLFVLTIWAYYTWPGLMIALGAAVPIFSTMMAVYSWGRLPGMDIHILEPKDVHKHGRKGKGRVRFSR